MSIIKLRNKTTGQFESLPVIQGNAGRPCETTVLANTEYEYQLKFKGLTETTTPNLRSSFFFNGTEVTGTSASGTVTAIANSKKYDYYLNTQTDNLYCRTDHNPVTDVDIPNTWVLVGTVKGDEGLNAYETWKTIEGNEGKTIEQWVAETSGGAYGVQIVWNKPALNDNDTLLGTWYYYKSAAPLDSSVYNENLYRTSTAITTSITAGDKYALKVGGTYYYFDVPSDVTLVEGGDAINFEVVTNTVYPIHYVAIYKNNTIVDRAQASSTSTAPEGYTAVECSQTTMLDYGWLWCKDSTLDAAYSRYASIWNGNAYVNADLQKLDDGITEVGYVVRYMWNEKRKCLYKWMKNTTTNKWYLASPIWAPTTVTSSIPEGYSAIITTGFTEYGEWNQTIYLSSTQSKANASEITLKTGANVSGFVTQSAFDASIGTVAMGTTATTVKSAIKEINDLVRSATTDVLTTNNSTVVKAINEHEALLRSAKTDTLTTNNTNVVKAINEHEALLRLNKNDTLDTTNKTVVKAINEHQSYLKSSTDTALQTTKQNVTGAINELKDAKLNKEYNASDKDKLMVVVEKTVGGQTKYYAEPVTMSVSGCPVGSILAWATTTLPEGWLVCDGSAVSRTSYAKLFAKIGIKYGAGNGTDTFNLPNLTDKFIEGTTNADANVGTSVSAGLPNISGRLAIWGESATGNTDFKEGAFSDTTSITCRGYQTKDEQCVFTSDIRIDASDSNAIYGASTTVQPPAVKMLYIICTGDTKPEEIVDTMYLANSDGATIKFGKDAQGNYGYYKGTDPSFNKFANPMEVQSTYTELGSFTNIACTSIGNPRTLTLTKSVTPYDALYIGFSTGIPSAGVSYNFGLTIPSADYSKIIYHNHDSGVFAFGFGNFNDKTFNVIPLVEGISTLKVYGITYRADIDPPTSMRLSTDQTKEIKFGQNNGKDGYFIDNNTFVPFGDNVSTTEYVDITGNIPSGNVDSNTAASYTLSQSVNNFDSIYVSAKTSITTNKMWSRIIHKNEYGKCCQFARFSVDGTEYQLEFTVNGTTATVWTQYCAYTDIKVYGIVTRANKSATDCVTLASDTTKSVKFDKDANNNYGFIKSGDSTMTSFAMAVLDSIYPVGSIAFGHEAPKVGTWNPYNFGGYVCCDNSLAEGKVLGERLPNVKGQIRDVLIVRNSIAESTRSGAFVDTETQNETPHGFAAGEMWSEYYKGGSIFKIDASDSTSTGASVYKDAVTTAGYNIEVKGLNVRAWIRVS